MIKLFIPIWAALISCGAATTQLENDFFFKHPRSDRVERMRQYSLDDQYKIFRYGNDKIEPPVSKLAIPLAERGADIVPFLLEKLKSDTDDLAVKDILLVFRTMQHLKSYDIRANLEVMGALQSRISTMRDRDRQALCREQLEEIKDAPGG